MKLILALQSLLICSCAAAVVADWPRWRGPAGNGHAPRSAGILNNLPTEPNYKWKFRIGPGLASPVVSGNKVVYFDAVDGKETLHAIDRETRAEIWKTVIDDTFHDTQGPDGPRSTPLIDEDRVYAVSCRGQLDCLNLKDGSKIWGVNYVADFGAVFIGEKGNIPGAARHGNNSSPLIAGDYLYALAGGANGSGVVCLDKKTGRTIWNSQNDQAAYAPPVIARLAGVDQLLCFMSEGLLSLDPATGSLLWRFPIETAFGRHVAVPVWRDDIVVVSSHQAGMIGIKVRFDKFDEPAPLNSPKFDKINHNRNGRFVAEQAWISKDVAINFSSPVMVGNYLYGLGPRKNLQCVEISTGKQTWSQDGYFQSSADKAYAGFLVIGEKILCLTDNGLLVLFKISSEKFEEVGTLQVCGANWCNPAFADGKLYLRDGNKGPGDLICLRLIE